MRGSEIVARLDQLRNDGHIFVKWWRKEEDFLDYDLIDRFVEEIKGSDEIGGIELLSMDDMWSEVSRVAGTRVMRLHDARGESVTWVHDGKTGLKTNTCPYTPETLLEIYDVETKGNPVDS